jgi:hypothetical protein
MSVMPGADQVQALAEKEPEGPIVMVNLLKFCERAEYELSRPEVRASIHRTADLERTALPCWVAGTAA